MATSRSRQSDTTHQPSVRPADRYFQHEMTHQLYRGGGEGERHAEKVLCEREREGGGNKALFICRIFFKAGRSAEKKRCSDRETRGASRPEVQRAGLCRPPVRLRQSALVHSGSSSIYKRYKRISNLGRPLKNHPHRAARGGSVSGSHEWSLAS